MRYGQITNADRAIRADYKRRQGNLVLKLAKFIKPEYYENTRKRKANDNKLKRSLGISRRNTGRAIKKFFSDRSASISSEIFTIVCRRSKRRWSVNAKNRTPHRAATEK